MLFLSLRLIQENFIETFLDLDFGGSGSPSANRQSWRFRNAFGVHDCPLSASLTWIQICCIGHFHDFLYWSSNGHFNYSNFVYILIDLVNTNILIYNLSIQFYFLRFKPPSTNFLQKFLFWSVIGQWSHNLSWSYYISIDRSRREESIDIHY